MILGHLKWKDVLARKDEFIGGNIESQGHGKVRRGQLREIVDDGYRIHFLFPWCARMKVCVGEWEYSPITSFTGFKDSPPRIFVDEGVLFERPSGDICILSTRRYSHKPDQSKVKGLPPAWERLMRLFPGLEWNLSTALMVCEEKQSFEVPRESLSEDISFHDFLLKMFKYGESREEFLWHYIEIVTGEKDIHKRIY